jgi:hypothetical protein
VLIPEESSLTPCRDDFNAVGTQLALSGPASLLRFRRESMDLRRAETKGTEESTNRRTSRAQPDAAVVGASLRWVTTRIPADLVRDIEAHAKRGGTTRSDAIRECLAVGIETIRHRDGVPGGRVEEILGAIESVRLLLELLGPPTLGTQRLLAHWASRDGAVKVSEEDLLAELRSVSADEWEQAVADVERGLPRFPSAAPDDAKA